MKKTLAILIVLVTISCSTQSNVDIKNYPIVTTVSELSDYYGLNIDKSGKHETTSTTKYYDGAYELSYEYELLESDEFAPLYYSISISSENSIKDAKQAYVIEKGAVKLVGNTFEQGTIEIDSLDLPGDDSYYAMRTYEEEINGMFYIVRKGTKIYTMMVSGFYTPDNSLIEELIIPKLNYLDGFEIIKE